MWVLPRLKRTFISIRANLIMRPSDVRTVSRLDKPRRTIAIFYLLHSGSEFIYCWRGQRKLIEWGGRMQPGEAGIGLKRRWNVEEKCFFSFVVTIVFDDFDTKRDIQHCSWHRRASFSYHYPRSDYQPPFFIFQLYSSYERKPVFTLSRSHQDWRQTPA